MAMNYCEKPTDKSSWYYTEEDDKKVLALLREWRPRRLEAKEKGDWSMAPVPEFVGVCVMTIAKNIAKRHNYHRHAYLDDMISHSVEYVFRYLHSFDCDHIGERSGRVNFHSYCTRIIDREFGKFIRKEHTQDYIKLKSFDVMGGVAAFEDDISESPELVSVIDNTDIGRDISTKVAEFEQRDEEKRQKERERRQLKAKGEDTESKPTNGLARLLQQRKEKQNND